MKDVKVTTARGRARPAAKKAAEVVSPAAIAAATLSPEAKPARAPVRRAAPKATPKTAPAAVISAPAPVPAAPPVAVPMAAVAPEPAPEPAPAPNLVETFVAPIAALDLRAEPLKAETVTKPVAAALETGAESARTLYAKAQETGETLRHAVTESATATTRGLVELNGQMLDLVRAQSDATLAMWRQAMTASSVSEAIRVQTSGVRQVYETSARHWKTIAETAGRTAEAAARPMQSAFTPRG